MSSDNTEFRLKERDVNIYFDSKGQPAIKIQREILPNGQEFHQVVFLDSKDFKKDKVYMAKWMTSEQSNNLKLDDEVEVEEPKKKPKHTGGKPPYLMLMINEIEELRNSNVKNVEELIGYVACLGKNIEWNTGKLVKNKRRKTHEPLQYKDLLEIFKCSNGKLAKTIKQLKDIGVLEYKEVDNEKAYFISQKYIKKGKSEKS